LAQSDACIGSLIVQASPPRDPGFQIVALFSD
jgi:hypothetical protein